MELVIKLLGTYWKPIGLALLVLAAVLYVEHLRIGVADEQVTISKLQAENNTLKLNVATLTQALDVSKQSLSKFDDLYQQNSDGFAKLGVMIASKTGALSTQLGGILKEPKPVTCADTTAYLIDAVKGYQK